MLDEVANGLSFYDYTFLHEVPRLHCALEDRLNEADGGAQGELASFLTHGKLDRRRPRRQSVRHRGRDARHAAAAVEPRAALLSRGVARARLRTVARGASCRRLRRICARSPSARPTPRRIGAASRIGWRSPASMPGSPRPRARLDVGNHPAAGRRSRALRRAPTEFKADLDVLDRSLISNNSGVIARGRLRLLRRAVDCFGFHLASLDIRQNSAVHERTVAELFDAAMPGMSYLALSEEARIALLPSELRNARPLTLGLRQIQRGDAGRTRGVPRRRRGARQIRRRRDPPMHHLHVQGRVRHAGGGAAAEGGRPRRSLRPQRHQHRAAVRDHRGSAGLRRHHGPDAVAARLPQAGGQPRRGAGGDARLFRQQQGWRLRHLGLGALQGRDRPGRGVRAPPRAPAAVPRPRRLGRPRRRAEL